MTEKEAARITRQRIQPRITDFCFLTTRAHLKAFRSFVSLLRREKQPVRVLDLGCGQKPFERALRGVDVEKYIGVDFDTARSKADIVASVDNLPLEESTFDAIIATEVLEHTPKLEKAVDEMRRVAKNGSLIYVSTPFMFPEHGTPYDFQRITRYKYQDLFRHDEILLLHETNTSFATPFFLFNVSMENIAILRVIPILPSLLYLWNNAWALLADLLVHTLGVVGKVLFRNRKGWFQEVFSIYFSTMPGGYDLIVRIKK